MKNIVDLLSNRWDFSTDISVYDVPLVRIALLDPILLGKHRLHAAAVPGGDGV